jgi:hypothetical protein
MPFCPNCGKTFDQGNAFCPHCGVKILSTVPASSGDLIAEEEFRAFIGKKADHYLSKFQSFFGGANYGFAITWSWSACFLGFIWMLYRKMYLWALLAFFIAFTPVAFPLTMIGWGIFGNYIYFLHARKKIIDYKSRQTQMSMALPLSELGGVNRWVGFVGFIFLLLLLSILVLGVLLIFHFLEYQDFSLPKFIEI